MTRVDEAVEVSIGVNGEPNGFTWQGVRYSVNARPLRWFARREWWVEAARVQRGIGAGVIEIEMWRVCAAVNGGPTGIFELIYAAETSCWKLVRYYLATAA
ncbi:MAG: DUF6504 family protein [Micrococcales bacterium]